VELVNLVVLMEMKDAVLNALIQMMHHKQPHVKLENLAVLMEMKDAVLNALILTIHHKILFVKLENLVVMMEVIHFWVALLCAMMEPYVVILIISVGIISVKYNVLMMTMSLVALMKAVVMNIIQIWVAVLSAKMVTHVVILISSV